MPPPKDPLKYAEYCKMLSERALGNTNCVGRHTTKETRELQSKSKRGKPGHPMSEKSRKKMSILHSGEGNPMYGKRGKEAPMFGKHHSKESIEKNSISHLGKQPRLGAILSDETRERISKSRLGQHPSIEACKKMSNTRILRGTFARENNPSWKGGISFDPYPPTFTEAFKRPIREYYGNTCINCGKTREKNGRELTCHHYDYDKSSMNCVPTCASCNSIANGSKDNGSRAFWEDWYTEILNEFYNDQYCIQKAKE